MRTILLVAFLIVVAPIPVAAQSTSLKANRIGSAEDEKAIQQVISNMRKGGEQANAKLATMELC